MNTKSFTTIIHCKKEGYVSLCPELDIANQGDTLEEARQNLSEAVQVFLETASETEIKERVNA